MATRRVTKVLVRLAMVVDPVEPHLIGDMPLFFYKDVRLVRYPVKGDLVRFQNGNDPEEVAEVELHVDPKDAFFGPADCEVWFRRPASYFNSGAAGRVNPGSPEAVRAAVVGEWGWREHGR